MTLPHGGGVDPSVTGDYELQSDVGTPAGSVGPGSAGPAATPASAASGGVAGATPGATPVSTASVDIFTSHLPRRQTMDPNQYREVGAYTRPLQSST
jgi:hypothetical protein